MTAPLPPLLRAAVTPGEHHGAPWSACSAGLNTPLSPGYDGERQLAELRALTAADTSRVRSWQSAQPDYSPLADPPAAAAGGSAAPSPGSADSAASTDLRRVWRDGAALPPELPLRDYPIARRSAGAAARGRRFARGS
jgi:hypothetical protein